MTADDLYSHSGSATKAKQRQPSTFLSNRIKMHTYPSLRSARCACVFTRAKALDDFDVERVESDVR